MYDSPRDVRDLADCPTHPYPTSANQESHDGPERIRQRAYELWQQEGQPEGKQQEHWDRRYAKYRNPDQSGGNWILAPMAIPSGNLTEAADAMRGVSTGSAEGTDADQFGSEKVEPAFRTNRAAAPDATLSSFDQRLRPANVL